MSFSPARPGSGDAYGEENKCGDVAGAQRGSHMRPHDLNEHEGQEAAHAEGQVGLLRLEDDCGGEGKREGGGEAWRETVMQKERQRSHHTGVMPRHHPAVRECSPVAKFIQMTEPRKKRT